MMFVFYGALIFWGVFLATPREGVIVALILFAVCIWKMLRTEVKN